MRTFFRVPLLYVGIKYAFSPFVIFIRLFRIVVFLLYLGISTFRRGLHYFFSPAPLRRNTRRLLENTLLIQPTNHPFPFTPKHKIVCCTNRNQHYYYVNVTRKSHIIHRCRSMRVVMMNIQISASTSPSSNEMETNAIRPSSPRPGDKRRPGPKEQQYSPSEALRKHAVTGKCTAADF